MSSELLSFAQEKEKTAYLGHGIFQLSATYSTLVLAPNRFLGETMASLRVPNPLPIRNPSLFVPKNGFPIVKALSGVM